MVLEPRLAGQRVADRIQTLFSCPRLTVQVRPHVAVPFISICLSHVWHLRGVELRHLDNRRGELRARCYVFAHAWPTRGFNS